MTFEIPSAIILLQADWDVDPRARGAFAGVGEAIFGVRRQKTAGWLPLTQTSAGFQNTEPSSATGPLRGVYYEFVPSFGYDVSIDTKLMIVNWQFNAPVRIQITTKANDGMVWRLGTGSGSPPANYRTWQISGNDTVSGQARENPKSIVIDLNASDHDAVVGTYDNTDVQCFGVGTVRFDMNDVQNSYIFFSRLFLFGTVKGASDLPRFTGVGSTWDDMITAMGTTYDTKITDEWIKREGDIFSYSAPVEIGDNSTPTTFNDNGATVFWPNSNDPQDPRVHVTEQAFRVYLNLRNNAADTATFSGVYDAGNSNPPWDFNQNNSAIVTFNGVTFRRTGRFDVGGSISGNAIFENCKIVWFNDNGVDLNGSTFHDPLDDHLVRLAP